MSFLKVTGLVLAFVVSASASASEMIQVGDDGIAKVPMYDAQGEQLSAVPVAIHRSGDGKAEIIAFRVPADDISNDDFDGILATWSVDANIVQDIGFTMGMIIGRVGCGEEFFKGLCGGDGVLIQAGMGANAVKASVGYGMTVGVGSGDHKFGMLGLPIFMVSGKATILKTSDDADGWGGMLSPSQGTVYVGGELDFGLIAKVSIGLFRRVSTNERLIELGGADNDWFLNLGTGIGF